MSSKQTKEKIIMWFITSLLLKYESIGNTTLEVHTKRTFGYFYNLTDAISAIYTNKCDMQECMYNYIVFETIEQGIHPPVKEEIWYHWEKDMWTHCSKPSDFSNVVNWAIG